MNIEFKDNNSTELFMDTVKQEHDRAIDCKEFGMWFPIEEHFEKNFVRIKYADEIGTQKNVTVVVYRCDNMISIESVEKYKEFYVYFFYNEFRNRMLWCDLIKHEN